MNVMVDQRHLTENSAGLDRFQHVAVQLEFDGAFGHDVRVLSRVARCEQRLARGERLGGGVVAEQVDLRHLYSSLDCIA